MKPPATTPILQIDAFADRPFAGNPAAVCLLDAPADPAWMQRVAAEMNLSETAFVWPGQPRWGIRFFTPRVEVPLCGHATLASAHALWSTGRCRPQEPIAFDSAAGPLQAQQEQGREQGIRQGDSRGMDQAIVQGIEQGIAAGASEAGRAGSDRPWIALDLPADPVAPETPPAGLAEALRTPIAAAGRGGRSGWWFVELRSAQAVRTLDPDLGSPVLAAAGAVCVTAPGESPGVDFVSRFFAPAYGIPEDPVTGSAHAALALFWGPRLGKREMIAAQLSARGGVIRVRPRGPRVDVLGQAITVLSGSLLV